MQERTRIVFLSGDHPWLAALAAGRALAILPAGFVEVLAACAQSDAASASAVETADLAGIGSLPPVVSHESVAWGKGDMVVALDREACDAPLRAGEPPRIARPLDADGPPAPLAARDRLDALVRDLAADMGRSPAAARLDPAALLEDLSEGVLAHGLDRRICLFNRAAEGVTGYRREDVLGRDCHDVFHGKFCGERCDFCEPSFPRSIEGTREMHIVTRSGERRVVRATLRAVNDPAGGIRGVLMCFRDCTGERERTSGSASGFSGLIGRDVRMLEVFDLIRSLADTAAPVMIQGESGTGKELIAAAIHNEGPRAGRPFVPVNCGALPESLLESELFGHVKGAFTGAIRDKKGRFELADGGTIFLDEIGDITPGMQVKLLRVLQQGEFERVGSEQTLRVDVRVISATHRDLEEELRSGRFREDLYYRLNVVPVFVPPLRERRSDIPLLVERVLDRAQAEAGRGGMRLSQEALDIMLRYNWPGNVRELQNWIQFALVKCRGAVIGPEHLPPARGAETPIGPLLNRGRIDAKAVASALREARGSRQEAARILGVSRSTLYRFIAMETDLRGASGQRGASAIS